MKNLIKRALNEFKSGWSLSELPEHILKIEKNIYVKLIKILGPVCVFLIVSGIAQQFNKLIFYYIFMFSFLYSLYRIIIVLYHIKQFIINVYTGKLIVRNSPVNHFNTIFRTSPPPRRKGKGGMGGSPTPPLEELSLRGAGGG